jgi:oxygen-independent coproporphyrinogen-3 oxidase
MLDIRIDFQKLRHRGAARALRRGLYYWLAGKEGWPPTFRRPDAMAHEDVGASPHVYVHIPFCTSICPHCPYNKVLYREPLFGRYARALLQEIDAFLSEPDGAPLESLYFGGGTPSLAVELVAAVVAKLRPRLASDPEIGIEVHPAHATLLHKLKSIGVTRISLGVETFDSALLKMLGRRYTPDQAKQAIADARATGFDCVDVNLICGIPGQDAACALDDVTTCLRFGADQISAYPLFTFLHTKLGERVSAGKFPIFGDRARVRLQREIAHLCIKSGFERSSVWSFTRPGTRPYTTVTRDSYRGFGAGAGSKIDGTFWFNTFSVADYASARSPRPALVLKATDRMRRAHWLYWQIYRTRIDAAEYERRFHRVLEHDFRLLLGILRSLSWVRRDGGTWRLSEAAAIWLHRLQCLFSLTYIDELWTMCQAEAWPETVALEETARKETRSGRIHQVCRSDRIGPRRKLRASMSSAQLE